MKDKNQAAVFMIEEYHDKIQNMKEHIKSSEDLKRSNNIHQEEWIIISWQMEIELLKRNIKTLQGWIVEQKFDY